EGQEAVADLLSAIKTFKKQDIEALIIMRGGGSLESMMAFNNELLVREVANFPVPVIAAIGHDKDAPLITLAADSAPSTPTAAAGLLSESWEQALLFLERYERDIIGRYKEILENYKAIQNRLKLSFLNFKNSLQNVRIDLKNCLDKYSFGFKALLEKAERQLEYAAKVINLNNPERQLGLGYSIAMTGGKIIRKTSDVKIGESLDVKVADGKIVSEIKSVNQDKNYAQTGK
ncbi:MAG: exodeoxyribonuclease VII large subunit, partial [Candidatus Wildermuthbacteria bacterium]|nr:exodeoxyribonuclease VII large subunit [Candidatus Wildermuthbacteria bacterium]